jgi:hypothetical protein
MVLLVSGLLVAIIFLGELRRLGDDSRDGCCVNAVW